MKKKTFWIIATIVVVVIGAIFALSKMNKKEILFNTIKVKQDSIQTTVTATGYVQPVDKVDVGTQVSGIIEHLYVDFNTQVKKGQLIAELDKSTLQEKLNQANASLVSAKSQLTFAQQSYDRIKQMYDSKAATKASYDDATNTLEQAKTNLINAKANLEQAQVNLNYAEIYSPIDGIVVNRAVQQGQTVAASFNTPTLFTIANDLTKMQVEANVDEADIGQVEDGQKVTFTVDSYHDDVFEGTVTQVRLQSVVTNNVVTYTVIITAPNPDKKLFPGMTANVRIITNTKAGLTVPNEALNFHPTPEVIQKLKLQDPTSDSKEQSSHGKGQVPQAKQMRPKAVWIQTSPGMIEHKEVKTGLSDGINTLIESGLNDGDNVVTSVSVEKKTQKNKEVANPLMPRRPQKK